MAADAETRRPAIAVQIVVMVRVAVAADGMIFVMPMNAASAMEPLANARTQATESTYSDGAEESMLYFFMSLRKYFRSISASRAAWLIL